MSDYKSIQGFKVTQIASDPSTGVEGQVWYNTTTNLLKYSGQAAAWSSGGNLNTARAYTSGCGSVTAALTTGGNTPGTTRTGATEKYDGTAWTSVNSLGSARYGSGCAGTQTAAINFGGSISPGAGISGETEDWNGTSWTVVSGGGLNLARMGIGPIGQVSTAALAVSGGYNHPPQGLTETYDGSTWTSGNNLNTARTLTKGAAGTVTAGIAVAGDTNPPSTGRTSKLTEEYNGTSWSNVNDCNNIRYEDGCVGAVQTAATLFGGGAPGAVLIPQTEIYDGTTWTISPNSLATARRAVGNNSGAASTAALAIGGNPGYLANVEEYSLAPVTKTVTTS